MCTYGFNKRIYKKIIGGIIIIRFIMLIQYISFIAWILSALFVMGFASTKIYLSFREK